VEPSTGYAQIGDQRVAYSVLGDGPIDIIFTFGFWGSFDVEWGDPGRRLFYEQLASFARVIRYDQRGSGASDPIALDALPPWESFVKDLVIGSDIGFEDRGVHTLEGFDGRWQLYSVMQGAA
jgi:pimeloyl-ACP methyl ester carboxylesterase